MYWAIDKNSNVLFPNFGDVISDEDLRTTLFCEEGDIHQTPMTYDEIATRFNELKADEFMYTQYENADEFIKDSYEFIIPLIPHEKTDDAIAKIKWICKHNKWHGPEYYTQNEMIAELNKAYNGRIPAWLEYGLDDILDYFWDIDCGVYQDIFD